jgi:hypothetical protein
VENSLLSLVNGVGGIIIGNMADIYELIEYKDGSGLLLEFEYDGETLWLSVMQIAALFNATRQNIERHISNIYAEGELEEEKTSKKNLGAVEKRPNMRATVYNLDMVISVGYRVKSGTATKFRQWATRVIKDRASTNYAALAQEEALRLLTRAQVEDGTERLIDVATKDHHVIDEDDFLAAGTEGLYHMSREDVETERGIPEGKLYDYIGSTELGMHVYRLTQTAEALKVDARKGYRHEQADAEEIHKDIAERTRAQSHITHGQYPEELPILGDIEVLKQQQIRNSQAGKAMSGEQLDLGIDSREELS